MMTEVSQEIESKKSNAGPDTVVIIPRENISAITEVNHDSHVEQLGEVRDFRWHDALKQFLPSENVISFSWVKLSLGETLNPHVHSTASMIIVCRGNGKLSGDKNTTLKEGDIIAVPAGCAHGFEGVEPDGFTALSVQFGGGIYTDPEHPRVSFLDNESSYESLLELNQKYLNRYKTSRFLNILTDGTLKNNPKKRQCYVEALQIWSDKNQDLLFARQATTTNTKFTPMFLEHLFEEVGHDRMHADRQEKFDQNHMLKEDPIIEAIASWFICQMFRADDIVKTALIHLLIENASHIFHVMARPLLAETINDEYFAEHEADTRHAEMGLKLLRHLSAEQYQELHRVVEKGWKMFMGMTDRVCELVDQVD